MKVVSRKKKEIEPKRVTCDSCGSELEYEAEDVCDSCVTCPECGNKIAAVIDTDDCVGHVPCYPKENDIDFYFFGNGKSVTNEEINRWIDIIIKDFERTPVEELEERGYFYMTGSGDCIVWASMTEDDMISIYVCRNYAQGDYISPRLHERC